MKKHKKSSLVLVTISFFTVMTLFFGGLSGVSGKPDKPNPNEAIMNMLEDIYEVVVDTNSKVRFPASVPQTGQTLCYDTAGTEIDCAGTGQDGEYQNAG